MKVINLKDGTAHYQGNPGFVTPHVFERDNSQHMQSMQTQRPGEDRDDQDDEGLEPDPDVESDPSTLPDEAPAVEPEDAPHKSALDIKRARASSKPM